MTPKEALDFLVKNLPVEAQHTTSIYHPAIRVLLQSITELEALKKPPTVEEVCKALSVCLAKDISYGAKQFYYTIEKTECIMFVTETYGDGLWSINEYLPPHLITLIGRFYERLEVKE